MSVVYIASQISRQTEHCSECNLGVADSGSLENYSTTPNYSTPPHENTMKRRTVSTRRIFHRVGNLLEEVGGEGSKE